MHRVIVWGTGFVGKAVLKSLLGHPEFEIAGVVVHDPAKDGHDVGDIVGGPKTSMGVFHYPPMIPAAYKDRIAKACEAGRTSFLSNGIDPGFGNDLFPMTLL